MLKNSSRWLANSSSLAQSFGVTAKAENVAADEDSFEVNLAGNDKELGLLIGPKGTTS